MKKMVSLGVIGGLVLMSFSTDLFGMEASGTASNSSTMASILEIKDPYEQCLAYVKMKNLEGTDCKKISDSIKQKNELNNNRNTTVVRDSDTDRKPTTPPPTNPTTGTGIKVDKPTKVMPLPEKLPPVKQCLMAGGDCDGKGNNDRSGSVQVDFKGLMGGIEKLSPTEKMELVKIIRTYLESKNIKTPSIDLYIPRKDEIKNTINTTKQEILVIKDEKRDEIRIKQEELRAKLKAMQEESKKNYVGHVTLIKQ